MCDQELLRDEGHVSISGSMHHLCTAAFPSKTAAPESIDKYTPVYTKRHSPSSPSQFQEPLPKRAVPNSPFSPPWPPADYNLLGYTKIQLPHSFPATSPPPAPLRRTLSEPIYSPGTTQPPAQQEAIQFPNAAAAASTVTPPRPPAGRNSTRSPISGGSHGIKKMKSVRERIKKLWKQVATEGWHEYENENCCCNDNNPKEECENDVENPSSQEAVWVEKKGESLVLHFKCPCGNGYEVLLLGASCYYKLTNF